MLFPRATIACFTPTELMKKNNAFTLIELLVVISIIAILATFGFSAFTGAQEKSRAIDCKNNLTSLGKGIIQYLNDTDETMFSLNTSGQDTWPNLLRAKYVKDWRTFRSPFDRVTTNRPKTEVPPVPVSYGLNQNVFDTFVGRWVNSSSQVILAAPAVDTGQAGKAVQFAADAFSTSNVKILPAGEGQNLGTHQSRQSINVLFADSHVEQMEWSKYVKNQSDLERQRWNPMFQSSQVPQR